MMRECSNSFPVVYMPDGNPAPYLLTADEAAKFLRIESKDPKNTLNYYCDKGILSATYISKNKFFCITELINFIARVTRGERTVQNGQKNRNISGP